MFMTSRALVFAAAVLAATVVRGQEADSTAAPGRACPPGWTRASAVAPITSGDERLLAPRVAFNRARELARLKAIEETCGAAVQSGRWYSKTQDESFRLQESYVRLLGQVLDDTLISSCDRKMAPASGEVPLYFIEVEICAKCACVGVGEKDEFFQVDVQVDASGRPGSELFHAGEHLRLRITPTRDAYLTILNRYEDNRGQRVLTVLYPNARLPQQELVPAGQTFEFPPGGFEGELVIEAGVLEGRRFSDEIVTVIATREPYPFFRLPPSPGPGPFREVPLTSGLFQDLMAALVRIRPQNVAVQDYPLRVVPR